jgi:Nif-specific regulatory protein
MGTTKDIASGESARPDQPGSSLQRVLDLCGQINAERELPRLLELIAREGAKMLACERVTIFLLDREKCELISQVTLDGEKIRLDARLGIAGACAMTGQVIKVDDAQQDQRFYTAVDARTSFQTRTVLAIPLRNPAGDVIGTFQCINTKHGVFTPEDEQVAHALASQAAVAIETAHLVEDFKRQQAQLEAENTQLRKEVEGRFSTQQIIGASRPIQLIVRLIDQIRDSSVDVLITGESGTGKEMIAKAIHYNSPRARKPFVAINCAALPETLVESELFGIEKGVATQVERRIGKFEEANGGTLFLDEIGDLSQSAQVKILRVLQERVLERVGGRAGIPVDVRVLAATNADLDRAIKAGKFRSDLYYRLNVVTIHTPPLREIREDIPLLARTFLHRYCQAMGKTQKSLSAGALRCLTQYDWPGNVRELENEIKRLVVSTRRTAIAEEDLADGIRASVDRAGKPSGPAGRSLKKTVEELERRLLADALQRCRGNQVQAAKLLGLSRQGLIKKIARYGLKSSPG